jgi:hypothetical protein
MKSLLPAAVCLIAAWTGAPPTAAAAPACRPAEPRPLEFWLGGRATGTASAGVGERRRLQAVLDGCAISEHWSTARSLPAAAGNAAGLRPASAAARRRVATARTATVPT